LALDPTSAFPDAAFDAGGAISLASVKAKASKDFALGDATRKLELGASGGFLAALGVYRKTDKLFDDLGEQGIDEKLLELSNLKIAPSDNLMVMRWGFDAAAKVNGEVAFSPLKINFGAGAKASSISAVMRPVPRSASIAASVAKAFEAWKVPRQVETVDNLEAGSYIITETLGSLDLSVGAEYGFSYSWNREGVKLGGLTGDLGLKIDMGIKAALNFSASGRYALVLSRESDARTIRVQVFRVKQNGWGFAFDAGFKGQLTTNLPPEHLDDFVKGVFNLHGSQVLKDFEKWAFSDTPLDELLGEELFKYAKDLAKDVTGIDVIGTATKKLREALLIWKDLPTRINSLVFNLLEKNIDLGDLKGFLTKIRDWNKSDAMLRAFIEEKLRPIDFASTPIGKFLSAYAIEGVLSMIANIGDHRASLADYANKALAVLDGGATEAILRKLQEFINSKLSLERIENLDIDAWLKARLTDFLGKVPGMGELNKLRDALKTLRLRADEIYKKGLAALTRQYTLDFNYTYQKSTSRNALIDVSIDFDVAGDTAARGYLKKALDGNFSEILIDDKLAGLTLNSAMLTHEIKRRSHLEINSTFGKVVVDHINNSLASAKAVDSEGGRLWLFSVDAEDIRKRRKNISKLAVSAGIYEKSGARTYEDDSFKARYLYVLAKKQATQGFVERRLELGVNNYLLSKLPEGRDFAGYLTAVDKALDGVENQDLGNLIASLEVTLPKDALVAWAKLPTDLTDKFYKDMSLTVQRCLRDWVPRGFIFDPEKQYGETDWIYPLFVWASMPRFMLADGDGIYYWRYQDEKVRREEIQSSLTRMKLPSVITQFSPEIPSKHRAKYEDFDKMLAIVGAKGFNAVVSRFISLCELERRVIKGVAACARALRKFNSTNDFEDKLRHLATFGEEFTETFNDDLGGEFAGKSLRPLGTRLMLEIAGLLDPSVQNVRPTAMLELLVVKPEVEFDVDSYLEGKFPAPDKLVMGERIINVQA
jgi:hypothetical protein